MSKLKNFHVTSLIHGIGSGLRAFGAAVVLASLSFSNTCFAHGFGEQLDLSIPLWLWLGGAALTVVLSFAVVIDFLPAKFSTPEYPRKDISNSLPVRMMINQFSLWSMRGVFAALVLLTIAAGVFGEQTPQNNLAPTMVWVIFWVGLTFAVALLGNFWRLTNPFATIYYLLFRSNTVGQSTDSENRATSFHAWPAVAILMIFLFVEHLWPHSDKPAHLSSLLLVYVIFTIAAMKQFGPAQWLRNGEIFSIIFDIFGRFAPIKFTIESVGGPRVQLRPPAVGLLDNRPTSTALMVFIFVLLAGVTFDGLIDIPQWQNFVFAKGVSLSTNIDIESFVLMSNLVLMAVLPGVFFLLFWFACALTRRFLKSSTSPDSWLLMQSYVTTLIPIAIAYHFAHYLTLLLVDGQLVIPLASDPFGWGWNLFGTSGFEPNAELFSSKFVWYFVVIAIVIGHMLSVYLAHLVTLTFSDNESNAVKAGTPILLLMVLYTVISLWVIAQPALAP